ncbi:MAG: hypothetical protein AAGB10_09755 [Pseudomonadota bacterium]
MSRAEQIATAAAVGGVTGAALVFAWVGYNSPLMHILVNTVMYCF